MARKDTSKENVREAARIIKEDVGKAGASVKAGIISGLKGINEIEAEIVSLVRNTVSNAFRATGTVINEGLEITKDVVKGAIQGYRRSRHWAFP
jgi:hypothetical protein